MARSNVPLCVTANYSSFKVVNIKDLTRAAIISEQSSTALEDSSIYHGAINFQGNQVYKMHQVAHGMYNAVNLGDRATRFTWRTVPSLIYLVHELPDSHAYDTVSVSATPECPE